MQVNLQVYLSLQKLVYRGSKLRSVVIDLKPEQQRLIDQAVDSGAYRTAGDVLDQAFELLRAQLTCADWLLEQREAVSAQIENGLAQAQRGELLDGDAALALLRKRRADRLGL